MLQLAEKYGSLRELADATDAAPGTLSQIKNETRQMGAKLARQFERKLELPRGWMDTLDHVPAQGLIEAATLMDDFKRLPPALREHVAKQAHDLRQIIEGVPERLRPLISAPPRDPARYAEWEQGIRELVAGLRRDGPDGMEAKPQ